MVAGSLFKPQREMVNYDYFDIAEGVGYVVYYGLKGDNGEYMVSTTNVIFSEQMCSYIEDQPVATTYTQYFDLDFDITFNRPKNIKGVIMVNVPIGMAATDTNNNVFNYYVIVKAIHYDSSTETLLATGTSIAIECQLSTGALAWNSEIMACKLDITTLTHFKKGETLRFTVEGWFKTSAGAAANAHIMIGHDPQNREFKPGKRGGRLQNEVALANEVEPDIITYQDTQMIFHIPFVLDI